MHARDRASADSGPWRYQTEEGQTEGRRTVPASSQRGDISRVFQVSIPVQRAAREAATGRGLLFTAPLGEAGPQRQSAGVGKCSSNFMARVGPRPPSEASLASARPPTCDTLY